VQRRRTWFDPLPSVMAQPGAFSTKHLASCLHAQTGKDRIATGRFTDLSGDFHSGNLTNES